MILDATTKSIEIDLGEAHTTNALPVTVDYVDLTTTTTTAGSSDTASNGTTAVTIVAAPAASTQRKVNFISVQNADTVSHVTTIQLNNNTILRNIVKVTLQVGETLQFTDVGGWKVIDSSGYIKTTPWQTMTSAQLAAMLTDETGTGVAVFGTSPTLTTPSIVSQTISGTGGNLYTSSYTPTLTNTTNISTSTSVELFYARLNDLVFMQYRTTINPTATGLVVLGISIPIASNFASAQDATGNAENGSATVIGSITADTTNDRLTYTGTATSTASAVLVGTVIYRII